MVFWRGSARLSLDFLPVEVAVPSKHRPKCIRNLAHIATLARVCAITTACIRSMQAQSVPGSNVGCYHNSRDCEGPDACGQSEEIQERDLLSCDPFPASRDRDLRQAFEATLVNHCQNPRCHVVRTEKKGCSERTCVVLYWYQEVHPALSGLSP